MCGIAGVLHKDDRPVDRVVLEKMCGVMQHRGPDDEGFFFAGHVGLGVRRLKIIDLTTGHQPIHNEDRSIWIILNGEIYNFPDLRSGLESKGHRFYTNTDTETIVHAYEEWGDAFVERLNGMFAFAIWDQREKKLVVCRDRLGIVPLYLYADDRKLIFASEIKAILQDQSIPRRVSLPGLGSYLTFAYVPAPWTMFEGIQKLLPGHMLIHHCGRTTIRQYWDYSHTESEGRGEKGYLNELCERLKESVRLRLISDVPLGAFLSGGIDSSIIVALMSELMDEPVKTFSMGFEEEGYNELSYARMVAEHLGTEHYELKVSPWDIEVLPRLIWHLDEPLADAAALPTYFLSEFARQQVTVVLTGTGGDELFGGYDRHRRQRFLQTYARVPRFARERLIWPLARRLPAANGLLTRLVSRVGMVTEGAALSLKDRYVRWMSVLPTSAQQTVLSADVLQAMESVDYLEPVTRYFMPCQAGEDLNRMLYVDAKTYLTDDILTMTDKITMAHSLEARVPLLDHHLVEFAATVPASLKVRGWETKHILRKYLAASLPREIWDRPKHGFTVPVGLWFKGDLNDFASQVLLSSQAVSRGFFNPAGIKDLLRQQKGGTNDLGGGIWSLLNFELWCCQFIDRMRVDA